MAEFEEKLGSILNNPQAMAQIMALAQSLSGGSASQTGTPPGDPSPLPCPEVREAEFVPVSAPEAPPAAPEAPFAGLDLDPKLLSLGMRALGAYRDQSDDKARLLQALRPFVKEKRYGRIDQAAQIARISKAIRAVLDGLKGDADHV